MLKRREQVQLPQQHERGAGTKNRSSTVWRMRLQQLQQMVKQVHGRLLLQQLL
jgi:hypothetical protein